MGLGEHAIDLLGIVGALGNSLAICARLMQLDLVVIRPLVRVDVVGQTGPSPDKLEVVSPLVGREVT